MRNYGPFQIWNLAYHLNGLSLSYQKIRKSFIIIDWTIRTLVTEPTLVFSKYIRTMQHYLKHFWTPRPLTPSLQVISFIDVFLRYTPAKHALCVVPVNTLQNWVNEFDRWLPANKNPSTSHLTGIFDTQYRTFGLFLLSESTRTMEARVKVHTHTGHVIYLWCHVTRGNFERYS